MMVNGDWMENESSLFLNEYGNTIKFMNVPVVSALGDKIGVTEEQLSELVSFVDGDISSVSFTYTEDQLRAVREARSIIYNNGAQHTLVVPASTPKFEEVKDFLVYLYSNESQKIYARRLNGLTMPYGFDISTDSTIETSDVTQSLFDCYGVNPSYIFTDFSQILVYRAGWSLGEHCPIPIMPTLTRRSSKGTATASRSLKTRKPISPTIGINGWKAAD